MGKEYISIIVAPYAIADFIRALYRNGDHDIAVTKEDNDLTVRIPLEKYCYEAKEQTVCNPMAEPEKEPKQ